MGDTSLGSATTLISYIKPVKTGDGDEPPARVSDVDELGVRAGVGSQGGGRPGNLKGVEGAGAFPAPGKPLSHVRSFW